MRFEVRVLDVQQQLVSWGCEAADEADARAQALAKQLTVLSVAPARSWLKNSKTSAWRQSFDVLLFAQELHALISAGLSVVEALEALLERQAQLQLKKQSASQMVLPRLIAHLKEGLKLSEAMDRQAQVFPPILIGIMQAAENTSDLPRVLERYIAYESQLKTLRQKITSAAIYPSILLSVGTAVALFLLVFVVPRFAQVYQGSGRDLPWASELLLRWGQFATQNAATLTLVLLGSFFMGLLWGRKKLRSGSWWHLLAWLPGIGPRLLLLDLSRLYLTLGMLLEGGIALPKAMQLCPAALPVPLQLRLHAARHAVMQGQTLGESFAQNMLSTPVAMRLLRVGEQTGQLGHMLSRTAAFYDNETARWIERFSKAFEPMLMAAIGVVIGLIVVLLYMPIFDLAGSLQ